MQLSSFEFPTFQPLSLELTLPPTLCKAWLASEPVPALQGNGRNSQRAGLPRSIPEDKVTWAPSNHSEVGAGTLTGYLKYTKGLLTNSTTDRAVPVPILQTGRLRLQKLVS